MDWCAIGTPLPITHFSGSFNLSDKNWGGLYFGLVGHRGKQPLSLQLGSRSSSSSSSTGSRKMGSTSGSITMRDRSKNRKPLQRGRNLSIEGIQIIQALKRAAAAQDHHQSLERVFDSKFKRLLKLDMMAVLRELLRQNECFLALKVFEDVQKEYWYKPKVSLYGEIISVLGSNGFYERVGLLFMELKTETGLEPDTEEFNLLLEILMSFGMSGLAMECFYLMKSLGCEPDKSSFRILINGLESKGEACLSAIVRQEAEKYYGKNLEFLEEKEELVGS